MVFDTRVTGIPDDDITKAATLTRAAGQHVSRIGFTKVVSGGVDSEWGALVGNKTITSAITSGVLAYTYQFDYSWE